ncbi:MAG: ABC transporter substrate-binding protein [Planctomycetota bacterium]|nr:MAG: ABC transporter substrate-binding protein [Planctomycetota bacterium]
MIWIGIDDTDIVGSPGTNQLARAIVRDLQSTADLVRITRHQLLDDPRVPYTSQNGSASILLEPHGSLELSEVIDICRHRMMDWYIEGSDPGLCVSDHVPRELVDWGRLCQRDLVHQSMAYELAESLQIHLEGLGGTRGGVIGALAALGLAATEDDGRLVMWQLWPDDLSGPVLVDVVRSRSIHLIERATGASVVQGQVDVGKHLRPNMVGGRAVLWVTSTGVSDSWQALKVK